MLRANAAPGLQTRFPRRSWIAGVAVAVLAPVAAFGCTDDAHDCPRSAKQCATFSGEVPWMQLTLEETSNGGNYFSVHGTRTLSVGNRSVLDFSGGSLLTGFEAETAEGLQSHLGFGTSAGFTVESLPPTVEFTGAERTGPCVMPYDKNNYERETLSASSVRQDDASLLVAYEHNQLLGSGRVERAPIGLDEIELRWIEAGCSEYCGEAWFGEGDELKHSVALVVTPRGGQPQTLMSGDIAHFELGGERFVFALVQAVMTRPWPHSPLPAGTEMCGNAAWTLSREGLLVASPSRPSTGI